MYNYISYYLFQRYLQQITLIDGRYYIVYSVFHLEDKYEILESHDFKFESGFGVKVF